MVRCSFCGESIQQGTGKIFVRTNAKVLNFCTRKCEKNMLSLGRKARETKWTNSYVKNQ